MELDKLGVPVAEWVRRLKSASSTIQADVQDALVQSRSQPEFTKRAEEAIWSLIGECNDWLNHLKHAELMAREQPGDTPGSQRRVVTVVGPRRSVIPSLLVKNPVCGPIMFDGSA